IHHKNRMRTFLSHAIPQLILDQSNTHNPNKPFSSAFRHIMDLIKKSGKTGIRDSIKSKVLGKEGWGTGEGFPPFPRTPPTPQTGNEA
uniref:hypothetical protein n=1 Tax=Bilophila wadsworthia TaxID=35833 RepID=UPI003FEDAA32